MLVVLGLAGAAWAGEFDVGVYAGRDEPEWVSAVRPVSGMATIRYTYPWQEGWESGWFIGLPPGGDASSDWVHLSGWTSVGMCSQGRMQVSDDLVTSGYRDGQWEVWVVMSRRPEEDEQPSSPSSGYAFDDWIPYDSSLIISEPQGPFTFAAKNLSVTGLSKWGDRVTLLPPFVSVGPHDDTTFSITSAVDDGYECPEELDDHFTLRLSGLGSTGISYIRNRPSDAAVPDPVDSWTAAFGADTWPGLYYVNSLVAEPKDSDEWLSKYLSLESLDWSALVCVDARTLLLELQIVQSCAVSPERWAEAQRYVLRTPNRGDLQVTDDGPLTGPVASAFAGPYAFDLAGTYVLAGSLRDEIGGDHDGHPRWCHPKEWTLDVPASVHFAGNGSEFWEASDFAGMASSAYATVGIVDGLAIWPVAPDAHSFYSGRAPLGERGGVVTNPQRARFLEACWEDHVVHFSGHGGYPICEVDDCVCHTEWASRAACPDPAHEGYRPYRLVLSHNVPSNSVVPGDFVGETMPNARVVVLMCCHQLRPGGLGHTMHGCMDYDGAVVGYAGLSTPICAVHDMGIEWINDRLWEYLAAGWSVDRAVDQVRDDWVSAHGWLLNPDDWELDNLTHVGDTTIAPAF